MSTVTAGNLPLLSQDVLFLADGSLLHWHGQSGQVETLLAPEAKGQASGPGAVIRFTVSADNRFIALQRVGQTRETYEVVLLELETRALINVHQGTLGNQGVLGLAFSPDGQWLAYVAEDNAPAASGPSDRASGTVYIVPTDALDQVIEIGACARVQTEELDMGCLRRGQLLWSPDNSGLVWSDGYGLWLGQVGGVPRLLTPNLTDLTDEIQVFSAWSWSPSGDYLLAWIGHYEGVSQAVVDVRSGHVFRIPDSYEYGETAARTSWMDDGRLIVVRRIGNVGDPTNALAAEIWHISTSSALVLDQTLPIEESAEGTPRLVDIERLAGGQLAFGILNMSNTDYQTRGLYLFTPGEAGPRKVTGLPPTDDYWVELAWASDGSGAFVRRPASGQLLYAPRDGSAVYDLRGALGRDVCCLAWLK